MRTDNPKAELGLFEDDKKISRIEWQAHRALAETIHTKLVELLKSQQKDIGDIKGIVLFQGPGSFTGLRIGASVANALAYSFEISIVGSQNEDWEKLGLQKLINNQNDTLVIPDYGSEAFITKPKK